MAAAAKKHDASVTEKILQAQKFLDNKDHNKLIIQQATEKPRTDGPGKRKYRQKACGYCVVAVVVVVTE